MKCRPILFTPAMAQKCHDGSKTQTRRVVKPQPDFKLMDAPNAKWYEINHRGESDVRDAGRVCPYGQPGDRLWVRERCWIDREPMWLLGRMQRRAFFPDGRMRFEDGTDGVSTGREPGSAWTESLRIEDLKLNSSLKGMAGIHMPRWACRTILEVVKVRVERVEDITEEDAIAEGFAETFDGAGACHERNATARDNFLRTFYDINKRAPRWSNPWVWVVEFRRVKP